MAVYLDDFFDRGGFEEGGGDAFFNAEDYAFAGGDLGKRSFSWCCSREEVEGWIPLWLLNLI